MLKNSWYWIQRLFTASRCNRDGVSILEYCPGLQSRVWVVIGSYNEQMLFIPVSEADNISQLSSLRKISWYGKSSILWTLWMQCYRSRIHEPTISLRFLGIIYESFQVWVDYEIWRDESQLQHRVPYPTFLHEYSLRQQQSQPAEIRGHKVHKFIEYHNVFPLVGIGTPPPPLPQVSVPPPPPPPAGGGGGGPNTKNFITRPTLCPGPISNHTVC